MIRYIIVITLATALSSCQAHDPYGVNGRLFRKTIKEPVVQITKFSKNTNKKVIKTLKFTGTSIISGSKIAKRKTLKVVILPKVKVQQWYSNNKVNRCTRCKEVINSNTQHKCK